MAINFSQGFNVTAQEPIDARIVLTKQDMVTMKKAKMPEKYLAICKDDGKIYLYDESFEVSSETGRFRKMEDLLSYDGTNFELAVKNSDAVEDLDQSVEEINRWIELTKADGGDIV